MLDCGLFRIGSESYAEQNESYGLATLKKEHVSLNGKSVEFEYPAKSGQKRTHEIADKDVKTIVTELKRRRGGGTELLAYRNNGRWKDLGSTDINEYIKESAKGDFSAKDFRTWKATVLAAMSLAHSSDADTKAKRERAVKEAVKEVAKYLGNTPAIARSSYIDPRVFDRYRSGWTIEGTNMSSRRAIEKAVLDLLEK
jgi:DNA topoisomerase IB